MSALRTASRAHAGEHSSGGPTVIIRVLGPLDVEADGSAVTLSSARQRALLTALVVHAGEAVSVDRLANAVWGERLPQFAAQSLQTLVARLRKALRGAAGCLVTRPSGYMLAIDGEGGIDAHVFEARYGAARERLPDDANAAAELLDDALALWRGEAYDEFADGFACPEATRLEQLRLSALEDRAAAALRTGMYEDAISRASALAAAHPLRERPVELLMRGLHATGRTGEALAAYQQHRAIVGDELGLDPSPALREAEAQVLRDEMPRALPPDEATTDGRSAAIDPPMRSGLPWRPSPLIDRTSELRLLTESIDAKPLITLTGPGGVGKTRLALEVAHTVEADGLEVWWADLAAVTPARLVDALASAAGVELEHRKFPAGSLCDALSELHGLLCLDNAEHLLGALAPIVERVLDTTSTLSLLVTSRERLAVDAETVLVVQPLPLPMGPDRHNPAIRLFVDRSPALHDELTADGLEVIAQLCRQLDGLPLAIELAAAQAATLGLRQLVGRLTQRLDLLAGGRRTADTRHRTLRAVVDWSHDLLTDDEARLLARLAVFPGQFALDQVEAVCADDDTRNGQVIPVLARLVEQSLVQTAHGRFWLLESIHRYAHERLDDTGEAHEMRARHAHDTAGRLVATTPRLWTADEAAAVHDLAALVPDLHAAWDHASEHDRPLAVRLAADIFDFAYFRLRLDLLEWGTQVAGWDIDHPCLPGALATAAAAGWMVGHLEYARGCTHRAITAAGGRDQPPAAAALDVAADLAMFGNRTDDAVAGYTNAAALFYAAGNDTRGLCTEIGVAHALAYAGRLDDVETTMADLLPRARDVANPTTLALAHFVIGEAASAARDHDHAMAAYAAAIDHGNRVDSRLLVASARSAWAAVKARSGSHEQALDGLIAALDEFEHLGNRSAAYRALLRASTLLIRLGGHDVAALLAGAIRASSDRYPLLRPDRIQLDAALADLRRRLGADATRRALSDGARLSDNETLTRARHAIQTARTLPDGRPLALGPGDTGEEPPAA